MAVSQPKSVWSANVNMQLARRRAHEFRAGKGNTRILSADGLAAGLAGELAFGQLVGMHVDLTFRTRGDGGHDFELPDGRTVDVKTQTRERPMLIEVKRTYADLFVAAYCQPSVSCRVVLLGWLEREQLDWFQPSPPNARGIVNYEIPLRALYDMDYLL